MRWDGHRKSPVVSLLSILGKPIFWLTYSVMAGLISASQTINSLRHRIRTFKLITKAVLRNASKPTSKAVVQKYLRKKKLTWFYLWTLVVLMIASVMGLFYWTVLKDLPTPQQLVKNRPALSTKIYDRNGILLYKIYQNENRSIVPLSNIPNHVINATIAIEDASFYNHAGFSFKGIVRALRKNATSDHLQGGSTITQQLVKNTLLTSEKTITRKIKELWLSLLVEYYFTKDEILSMYLNEVGYGGTAYGIEEAAQQYFGKSVRDVSLAEAALLAGLPQSPTIYSPYGAAPELSVNRQQHVLQRMFDEGMITERELGEAKEAKLTFMSPKIDILAPHFVMWVKDMLVKEYGEDAVMHNGLEVITTLDSRIQTMTEAAIKQELSRLKSMQVSNGAAMVTNPKTGEILAMVGSVNYFDTAHDGQVNVALRPRQPGSSIKPLTYALALSERYITPATLIADVPVVYSSAGSAPYAPKNYDGRFHGNVTVRDSLANSYNIPAVKTLAQVGVSNFVNFASLMGITTWTTPERYGLALTLGGGEVRMVDMAEAYGVFAYGGKRVPLTPFVRVIDPTTKVQFEYKCRKEQVKYLSYPLVQTECEGKQVLDEGVAFLISDILADNQARSAAFGRNSVLVVPNQQVAVKTGTTNDLRDNWTFGYTSDYLTATWVGNNDNTRMSNVASGITGASPIWQVIMKGIYANQTSHFFIPPSSVIKAAMCRSTNITSCGACDPTKMEYYLSGTEPKTNCFTAEAKQKDENSDTNKRDRILQGTTITPPALRFNQENPSRKRDRPARQ